MNITKVFEEFEKDVKNHTLKVIKIDGLYRHLRFSDGTSIYRFDIITWPGNLCISGDMGCQVFERLGDMFEFFDNKDLKINPSYWSEKSQAGEVKKFNHEGFCESIEEVIKELRENIEGDLDTVKTEILELIDELKCAKNSSDIYEAVAYLRSIINVPYDVYETLKFEDYSYGFIWRLFAIVWGIQKFKNEFKDGN